jgi:hypothetical protein
MKCKSGFGPATSQFLPSHSDFSFELHLMMIQRFKVSDDSQFQHMNIVNLRGIVALWIVMHHV